MKTKNNAGRHILALGYSKDYNNDSVIAYIIDILLVWVVLYIYIYYTDYSLHDT